MLASSWQLHSLPKQTSAPACLSTIDDRARIPYLTHMLLFPLRGPLSFPSPPTFSSVAKFNVLCPWPTYQKRSVPFSFPLSLFRTVRVCLFFFLFQSILFNQYFCAFFSGISFTTLITSRRNLRNCRGRAAPWWLRLGIYQIKATQHMYTACRLLHQRHGVAGHNYTFPPSFLEDVS